MTRLSKGIVKPAWDRSWKGAKDLPTEIPGFVVGDWGMYPMKALGPKTTNWQVTHLPSGLACSASGLSYATARALVVALHEGMTETWKPDGPLKSVRNVKMPKSFNKQAGDIYFKTIHNGR